MTYAKNDIAKQDISFLWILALYLIAPICLLVYGVDQLVLNGYLQATLPVTPESYFLLSFVFGTPHIVASNIILLSNQDYIKRYKIPVLLATFFIIIFFSIGSLVFSYAALFTIVAVATVTHVVKQQFSLTNVRGALNGFSYQMWVWTGILVSALMYVDIFLGEDLSPQTQDLLAVSMKVLSVALILLAASLGRKTQPGFSRVFFIANNAIILISLFLNAKGYSFLAILSPRLIHDVTSFICYAVHDRNRHKDMPQNRLYRLFKRLGFHPYIAVPASAVVVTIFLQHYADGLFNQLTMLLFNFTYPNAISFAFVGYLGLLHYFTESFTWKGSSPYRRYIGFKGR